jgi:hypothetical protein
MTAIAEMRWNGWRVARWSVASALLLTPLVAMQFTPQVRWTVSDFVFAGAMIVGVGLLYELAVKISGSFAYRAGAAVGLGTCFLLVWINLAVGIIGDEDNFHNAYYFCEVLLAAGAAFAAALKPAGMMRAMLAAATFQALITAAAFFDGWDASEPPGPVGLLGLNSAFIASWLLSAALFRRAAQIECKRA